MQLKIFLLNFAKLIVFYFIFDSIFSFFDVLTPNGNDNTVVTTPVKRLLNTCVNLNRGSSDFVNNTTLYKGTCFRFQGGPNQPIFFLSLENNGNLVIFRVSASDPEYANLIWESGTSKADFFILRFNNNAELCDNTGKVIWSSNTKTANDVLENQLSRLRVLPSVFGFLIEESNGNLLKIQDVIN